MIKKLLLLIIPLITIPIFSQHSTYFKAGKNINEYRFTSSQSVKAGNIRPDLGNSYELGFTLPFKENKRFSCDLGVLLNDYNAYSSTQTPEQLVVNYTSLYLGIESALSYCYFKSDNKRFFSEIRIGADVNKAVFVKGDYLSINKRVISDLSDEKVFRGFIFMASAGIDFKYLVSPFTVISLGYAFRGSALNTGDQSSEYLGFSNHQIKVGLHFIIRKKRNYEE